MKTDWSRTWSDDKGELFDAHFAVTPRNQSIW
jgi:hypothetical protein